jgi:zinc transport system permease protein
MLFTRSYRKIVVWSVIAGFCGSIAGFTISWYLGIPTGATIIFTLVVVWILCKLVAAYSVRGVKSSGGGSN